MSETSITAFVFVIKHAGNIIKKSSTPYYTKKGAVDAAKDWMLKNGFTLRQFYSAKQITKMTIETPTVQTTTRPV